MLYIRILSQLGDFPIVFLDTRGLSEFAKYVVDNFLGDWHYRLMPEIDECHPHVYQSIR